MDPSPQKKFRHGLHAQHLLIEDPATFGRKFTFRLAAGDITVSGLPEHVLQVLRAARDAYGGKEGECLELLRLCTDRDSLSASSEQRPNIVWSAPKRDVSRKGLISLEAWIGDQYSLSSFFRTVKPGDASA